MHLTTDQLYAFRRDGYLVVEDLIDTAGYLDPLVDEYAGRLDELSWKLAAEGAISDAHPDLPFGERLTRLYAETGRVFSQWFDFSLPPKDVEPDTPCHFGPAVFGVLRNPDLLDVAEDVIGPEIFSNPVQHVRLMPPEKYTPRDPKTGRLLISATMWHQDAGVVLEEADATEMLTVWIPIQDATEENGCLEVVPRDPAAGLLQHCTTPYDGRFQIPEVLFDVDRAVPVPMRRGSALFMHRETPHRSLPNVSENVRWSMDLRYNPTGQATGRPEFPGFVARSRVDPDSELHDADAWRELWMDTRARMSGRPDLVGAFSRWKEGGIGCA
jgi:phytanoyl-CoA hydroxylase